MYKESSLIGTQSTLGHTIRLCALSAIVAIVDPAAVVAANGDDSVALEEIVVSANRMGDVSVQTTPMAISVISPASLDAKGLGSISDFVGTLPSVHMQSASPGENSIEMRGLVTSAVDPTNAQERSLVAIYLDDASITQQAFNPDLHVYDLERVEVVRGPQGTLYGAGSMAGTIRLITKKPDTKNYSGDGDLSISQTNGGGTNYSVRGLVNLPLIDGKLGARLSLYQGEDSGYIHNIELADRHSNPSYSTQARLAIRWLPTDDLTVDASATFARLNALGRNGVYPQLGEYNYETLTPEQFSDYFKLYNITADWDLSFAHLIAASTYTQRKIQDAASFQFFSEALLTPGILLKAPQTNENDVHDFQEEIRLVSRPDQPLRWITGVYFDRYTRFFPQNIPTPGFDAAYGSEIGDPSFNSQALYGTPTPNDSFYGTINVKERQLAVFGEATYAITPKLDLTLGARYFNFKDDFNLYFTGVAGAIAPGVPVLQNGEQKSTGANPRAVLAYKISDPVMVYAEAARGFRYGGVNEPAPYAFCAADLTALGLKQSPLTFGPDSLWSYTIGEKGTFAGDRFLFNIDGFYIDWRNVQTIHNLTCGYYFAEDVGRVKSQGVELESKWRVTAGLTLGLSGSFTDAVANGAIPNLGAMNGDRVPFFPRTIATFSADYSVPVPNAKIVLSTDYTLRSNAYSEFSPSSPLYTEVPSSKDLNASVGYVADRWSVSIYSTNLTNDHLVSGVESFYYPPVEPGRLQYWGRPRTVGLHLHVGF